MTYVAKGTNICAYVLNYCMYETDDTDVCMNWQTLRANHVVTIEEAEPFSH